MDYLFYIGIIFISIVSGYYFAKKILFQKNRIVKIDAAIEQISVVPIGDLWSPELLITYYFHYDEQKYYGKDYIRIDRFVGTKFVFLTDRNGFPVLVTSSEDFIGEEHIETYLLEHRKGIPVEFDTASLPHSRIYDVERRRNTMFQDTEINFPWTPS